MYNIQILHILSHYAQTTQTPIRRRLLSRDEPDPSLIILNEQGANAASGYNSRLLTVDLNTQHEFLNLATNRFQQVSTTRVLAHELGHAVLGKRDEGIPITIDILGKPKTITPYPNVRFTDGVMSGINGSIRKTYPNYCAPSCTVNAVP